MSPREILIAAREMLATQPIHPVGTYAAQANGFACGYDGAEACCFCSTAAVFKVQGARRPDTLNFDRASFAPYLLSAANQVLKHRAAGRTYTDAFEAVVRVNDALGKEGALEMFDIAIAEAPL